MTKEGFVCHVTTFNTLSEAICQSGIRGHIISKALCVCGATNKLADDLLPNKTLRDIVNRILESNNSSAENDMESAKCALPQTKIPSPSRSATSKGEQAPLHNGEATDMQQTIATSAAEHAPAAEPPVPGKGKVLKAPNVSEAIYGSRSMMEPTSQGSARPVDDEVQQKQVLGEAGKWNLFLEGMESVYRSWNMEGLEFEKSCSLSCFWLVGNGMEFNPIPLL